MGRTPDRHPGDTTLIDIEATFAEQGSDPTVAGTIRYVGGVWKLRDSAGVFDPRTGGSGITEGQHETLDSLVHNLAETSYLEVTRSSGQVTAVTVWTDSGKTTKVRETLITRSSGQVSTVVEKQYNGAGTLTQTLTHTVTRSNGQVTSIDSVES